MFIYFETTFLIIGWVALLSFLSCLVSFEDAARAKIFERIAPVFRLFILPTLLLAPVVLMFGYELLSLNFIFPVRSLVGFGDVLVASFIPGLVLFISSGLAFKAVAETYLLVRFWQGKGFYQVAAAFGKDAPRQIRWLVCKQALLRSWRTCLPWMFGELLIVEAMFNATGLGYRAWNLAKIRDVSGVAGVISWVILAYVFFQVSIFLLHRSLGKKLESYT